MPKLIELARALRRNQWLLLAALAALCILVLALGGRKTETSAPSTELEARLERVLSAIEGAGRVRVMIAAPQQTASAFAPAATALASGVLIVCEGADDLRVRLSIEQAAQALLGVESGRIQVIKMEGGTTP